MARGHLPTAGRGAPAAPLFTQTTVDCDDPHAQAAFWAAALGYLLEDNHDLVEAVLAAGYADRERDVVEVDGRLAWRTGTGIVHPDDTGARRGTKRRLLFQLVEDRHHEKNSWHLDLNVGRENIDAEVARLDRARRDRALQGRRAQRVPHHDGRPRGQPVLRPVRLRPGC